MENRVLLIDLDDTLIKTKSGSRFAKGPWDWMIMPGIIDALKRFNPIRIAIVSNQSKLTTEDSRDKWEGKVKRVIGKISQELNCEITYSYCCSGVNSGDPRRKPNPGMLLEVMEEYPEDTVEFLMVGDASGKPGDFSDSDRKAAENAGIDYLDINDFIKNYGT